jgi:hypothetical protein
MHAIFDMKTVIMVVEAWALCSTAKKNRIECIRSKYGYLVMNVWAILWGKR